MLRRRFIVTCFRYASGILLLALGGAGILHLLGEDVRRVEKESGLYNGVTLTGSGRDALAEHLSFFMLGGLSSLAAEIMVLDATSAWIERDWTRVEQRWNAATTLNPRRPNYWINAARDMAVNAAAHAANDSSLTERERTLRSRSFFHRGEKFLEDGALHHPTSALIRVSQGDMYADLNRFPNFGKAAEAYGEAVRLGAAPLYRRQEFYNLCRIRGREQEAWELGRALYDSPSQRLPSLLCLLFVLQNQIDVPPRQRLSVEQLFGSPEKARRELSRFEHNSLRFPVYGIKDFLRKQQS